jgi:hypothetical protein
MSHLEQSLDKHGVWGRHGTYMDYGETEEGTTMKFMSASPQQVSIYNNDEYRKRTR